MMFRVMAFGSCNKHSARNTGKRVDISLSAFLLRQQLRPKCYQLLTWHRNQHMGRWTTEMHGTVEQRSKHPSEPRDRVQDAPTEMKDKWRNTQEKDK